MLPELYKANPRLILVSGGRVDPSTPGPTLAKVMHDFLLGQGVKEEDLLVEERSTTTYENAVLSDEMLSQRGVDKIVYWLPARAACSGPSATFAFTPASIRRRFAV